MQTLILGLALFFGLHLVPAVPEMRARLRDTAGPGLYKLAFSLVSVVALVLMVRGYKSAHWMGDGNTLLWVLPTALRPVSTLLMLPAFILLAAAYIPSRIRTAAKHPMLAAITIWALAHLVVRGDLASVVLFGGFLAFSVLDRVSVEKREALGPLGKSQGGMRGDLTAVAVGTVVFAAMVLWLHGAAFGVPLLPTH